LWVILRKKYFVDEIYAASVVRFTCWLGWASNWFDRRVVDGLVQSLAYFAIGASWLNRLIDDYGVNGGFDEVCRRLSNSGGWWAKLQSGRVQNSLRMAGIAIVIIVLALIWGTHAG
jgi:NADH-quinone oxidoreductase subunit L